MSNPLVAWALPKLSNFLPLDEESLKQIITYSAGLSREESAEHLKNLLGDAPPVLEFISSFNSRRTDSGISTPQSGTSTPRTAREDSGPAERNQAKKNKRTKAPLHNAGPPRRPENYGNVSGGYKKSDLEQDYMTASSRPNSLQPDLGPGYGSSSANSRNPSPAPKSNNIKAPPSAAGPLISDYLPNVKSKTSKAHRPAGSGSGSGHSTPGKGSVTTTNIADLTSAIAALEVSTNPTSTKKRQKCDCNASIHPLFTPAPNCLSCGKIICSLEGLQPCSFCGAQLLSSQEIQSMIKELRAERGQEKMRAHNEGVHHAGGPGISDSGPPSKLDAAVAHRNKLLAFQAQNAQPKDSTRNGRESETKWEKKQTVLSLDIKSGRVVRSYHTAPSAAVTPDEEEKEIDEAAMIDTRNETGSTGAAFSKNPLLASGGLMRPIWKATTDGEAGGEKNKEVRRTWRRVQDDNDDNEQWILDGGAHGYSNDSGA
uniref:Uncharacterized protein C1A6.01c n=1 Tax=Talaromyces marneffei PM1 TaxID=1077442 RepID=A0A093V9B6_TALMA